MPRACRLGSRPRAGHAALRPRRRRPRLDPDCGRKLVVPDFEALRAELIRARASLERCARRATERERERLTRTRGALERGARTLLERDRRRLTALGERLRRGPVLLVERRRGASSAKAADGALAARHPGPGYAIVRSEGVILRTPSRLVPGSRVEVELAEAASAHAWRMFVSELTFETAQRELEQIVERLERGERAWTRRLRSGSG